MAIHSSEVRNSHAQGMTSSFEVVLEGEVAQHLEEGAVACGDANALNIRSADALLAGGHTMTGRLFLSQETTFSWEPCRC